MGLVSGSPGPESHHCVDLARDKALLRILYGVERKPAVRTAWAQLVGKVLESSALVTGKSCSLVIHAE